jgi:hypothetical protein
VTDGRDDGANEPPGSSGDQRHDEDAIWRQIVENYGDEPKIEDLADDAPAPAEPPAHPTAEPRFPSLARANEAAEDAQPADDADDEGFTPPPPPPVPRPRGLRLVAWVGLFGVPLLVLVLLLTGISLPEWGGVLCLAWFVGGFVYLVATMRNRSDDGWDDGARL